MHVAVQNHRDSALIKYRRSRIPDELLPGDSHGRNDNSGLHHHGTARRGRYRNRVIGYRARQDSRLTRRCNAASLM
jgi:hypothetical protein